MDGIVKAITEEKESFTQSDCISNPVFAMSYFWIPKTVLSNLSNIMDDFWWSLDGHTRKFIGWLGIKYVYPRTWKAWVLGIWSVLIRRSWLNKPGLSLQSQTRWCQVSYGAYTFCGVISFMLPLKTDHLMNGKASFLEGGFYSRVSSIRWGMVERQEYELTNGLTMMLREWEHCG